MTLVKSTEIAANSRGVPTGAVSNNENNIILDDKNAINNLNNNNNKMPSFLF